MNKSFLKFNIPLYKILVLQRKLPPPEYCIFFFLFYQQSCSFTPSKLIYLL